MRLIINFGNVDEKNCFYVYTNYNIVFYIKNIRRLLVAIAIEGMNGVGKITILKYISDKFGFEFIDKPVKYIFGSKQDSG